MVQNQARNTPIDINSPNTCTGGIGVISRGEWAWVAETARYVKYGFPIYEDARGGGTNSAALNEWYGRYGAGLCRQAAQRLGIP